MPVAIKSETVEQRFIVWFVVRWAILVIGMAVSSQIFAINFSK
jgi:hypothetical protein